MREFTVQAIEAVLAGIDLSALGVAYLLLIVNVVVTTVLYAGARTLLVISPNAGARAYGLYMAAAILALLIATVLENQAVPVAFAALPYAVVPHLLALLCVHLALYFRQEPWLVALAASSAAGALMVLGVAVLATEPRTAHWLALGTVAALLVFLWLRSISTKRAFLKARSIYAPSKEQQRAIQPQTPWLGLAQWVALFLASLALAALNELLRGGSLEALPAVTVLAGAGLLIGATALVSAIPALTYWLARKTWMPELTRLVWLVWLVVGFAFTYGNFLDHLEHA